MFVPLNQSNVSKEQHPSGTLEHIRIGREGDARGKRCGDICICITDSFCYKAETDTPL